MLCGFNKMYGLITAWHIHGSETTNIQNIVAAQK